MSDYDHDDVDSEVDPERLLTDKTKRLETTEKIVTAAEAFVRTESLYVNRQRFDPESVYNPLKERNDAMRALILALGYTILEKHGGPCAAEIKA